MTTAGYVVTAMRVKVQLRNMLAFREETEEPEALAAWATGNYPGTVVSIFDRHSRGDRYLQEAMTEKEKAIRAALVLLSSPMACMHRATREEVAKKCEDLGITLRDLLDYISDLSRY